MGNGKTENAGSGGGGREREGSEEGAVSSVKGRKGEHRAKKEQTKQTAADELLGGYQDGTDLTIG